MKSHPRQAVLTDKKQPKLYCLNPETKKQNQRIDSWHGVESVRMVHNIVCSWFKIHTKAEILDLAQTIARVYSVSPPDRCARRSLPILNGWFIDNWPYVTSYRNRINTNAGVGHVATQTHQTQKVCNLQRNGPAVVKCEESTNWLEELEAEFDDLFKRICPT